MGISFILNSSQTCPVSVTRAPAVFYCDTEYKLTDLGRGRRLILLFNIFFKNYYYYYLFFLHPINMVPCWTRTVEPHGSNLAKFGILTKVTLWLQASASTTPAHSSAPQHWGRVGRTWGCSCSAYQCPHELIKPEKWHLKIHLLRAASAPKPGSNVWF